MPRRKPPEKIAKGEWLEVPFDEAKFVKWWNVVAEVVHSDRNTRTLSKKAQDTMITDLTTAVGLAHETDLSRLPLVRHDQNGQPFKEKDGREMRPKLEPFRVNIFARDVLTAWEDVGLNTALWENENGQSPIVVFGTTLAHAVDIGLDNKSLIGNLRKAREYVVIKL